MNFFKFIFQGLFSEEISSLQKQIQLKQKALAEKDATISDLRHTNHHLKSKINACNQHISNLESQSNVLRVTISSKDAELSAKDQRIKILNSSLTIKQSEIEILNKQISKSAQRIDSLESANKELEYHLGTQRQSINEYKNTIHQLETSLNNSQQQAEHLDTEKTSLEIQVRELADRLSTEKTLCESKEKIAIEKSAKITSQEAELRVLEESEKSLKEEVDKLSGLLSERNQEIAALTSKKNAADVENNELKAKLDELQSKYIDEELLNALRADIKQKQQSISSLEAEIQNLNEELSAIRKRKTDADNLLSEKKRECEELKKELKSLSAQIDGGRDSEKALKQAEKRITELENTLRNAPTLNELVKRDKEIERLKSKIREYENVIAGLQANTHRTPELEPAQPNSPTPESATPAPVDPKTDIEPQTHKSRHVFRKPKFPYRKKPIAPSKDVVTVDFPVIENDNVYSQTARLIDKVFNHRSNSFITANEIFLHKSVEEISRMRFELEEATRTGVPYLTCPCCGNMVKISSRSVGFGLKSKEVQYFTHAVKNVPCDLKRDNSYTLTIDGGENGENDFSYLKELRNLLADSLRTELSKNKGFSDVEGCVYINSDELPIMKRRLADVTARYKDLDIVFELVTPTTHIARVHDRDIFYLINHKQVFWIFGLESIVNYNELRRSVSKDIFLSNKRNVFVFDLEAQEESQRRGELMLKCNWLDEDGAWYYQIEKNGKNGILISMDQIHFEQDGYRPYFYDADEPFYLKHPTAERPLKLSREKLKEDIIEAWNYEQERKRAIEQMVRENRGVEAYFDGEKWGFKFGDTIFIEPIFDVKPFMLGDFAKIERDGKFGVVNKYGDYRLKPEYDRVELIPNGYILYAAKDRWYLFGVVDPMTSFAMQDEVVVSTISKRFSIYHLILRKNLFNGQPSEEFYFIGNEIFKKNNISGKWSLWQSKGEKITDINWDSFEFTTEDKIKVSLNGRSQLLSLDGTIIEEQKYKSETKLTNGHSIVESFDGDWGIINGNDIEIVSPIYDAIIPLNDNYLKFKKGNLWGIITSTGKVIAEPIYHSVDGFDGEKFAVTKLNETRGWGYLSGKIDLTGKEFSEVVTPTESGTSITKSFEKYGLEKDSIVLIPHIYDSLLYWGENKYIAQKDGKFGIIDAANHVLIDFEYSSISPLKDGRSTIKKGTSQNEIDNNLKIVEDVVIELQEGYKKIKLGGKWGILNPEGQVIVDYLYDEISTFRGRLVGIINGRLIKLNAYYPYKLSMEGESAGYTKPMGKKKAQTLITVGGVTFQLFNKELDESNGDSVEVILINWASTIKYPVVMLSGGANMSKKSKHIDKPEDYITGESYDAIITTPIKSSGKDRNRIKGFDIEIEGNSISHIYIKDIVRCGLHASELNMGDKLKLTKLGFNDELDRTQWRIKKI